MNGRTETSSEDKIMDVVDDADSSPDPDVHCALVRAHEKEIACKEARLSYLNNIINIERKDARDTDTPTVLNLEKEKQDIVAALHSLQGELSIMIPCHVPDCDHNLKIKNLSKRLAESYIQPPKFVQNPVEFPALVPETSTKQNLKNKNFSDNEGFIIPTKHAKKTKTDDGSAISTPVQNNFSLLAWSHNNRLGSNIRASGRQGPHYAPFQG
ncbi:hypothetical protein TNIN_53031 [Trichonephila inaurata madagascariensis]|uniref:Uncharacterized protein n=1 Tax=Trichonephila inaurata madagascariensis TaxID=2747483 RepID=A0A8X6X7G8_9ARAC|nr:hypothetical protein TNIN_53031 [Trichonephila inaurata madagascariensis]